MKNVARKKTFTKKLLAASLGLLSVPVFALSLPFSPPWKVQDGKLLDPNGNPFIFRGVTIEQNLHPEKALQAIRDAAALGANAVQVEINGNLSRQESMITGEQLRAIINTCKESKVVCVLEPNDVAGYPSAAGSGIPATAASFWTWPGIREAIAGQQSYVILGFGNQYLAPMPQSEYIARMLTYKGDFGYGELSSFVLMIDGSGWGQDGNKGMYEFAKQFPNTSTSRPHIIYSVEMFDEYTDPEKVREYMASFAEIKAPLVVGGFALTPYYHPHNFEPITQVALRLPAEKVMQYAQQYGAGYFGWSWSGNKNSALDLVTNFTASALTPWGNILFNDPNGIKATAKPASIFTTSSSSSSSSSVPANQPPVANITFTFETVRCGQWYGNVSASGSSDPDGDPLSYRWEISGYGGFITSTEPSVRFHMQPPHYYTIKLTVSDGKGGVTSTSMVQNHTNSDYCIGSSSSSSRFSSSSSSRTSVSSSVYPIDHSSSRSSVAPSSSRSSSSVAAARAACNYAINSQWSNGFTAAIRIKNTSTTVINGWDVNWQYADGSKVTNLWNATLSGSNPYGAKNLSWNATIQPGQTVEFGFQGTKPAGAASVPVVKGNVCQ